MNTMTIITKLRLNALLFLCFLVLMGIAYYLTLARLNGLLKKDNAIDQIGTDMFELNLLTAELVLRSVGRRELQT